MIRRRFSRKQEEEVAGPKGFDDFDLRLGDMMRGERATLGKSLLDVQRELRIKASYIAAIENADPSAFDTPGFIAGYVRSYARYLDMDPDRAFQQFCVESGFEVAHGMSSEASGVKRTSAPRKLPKDIDPIASSHFAASQESLLSRLEPRAFGSVLVLAALIGGIGWGGWSVLKEIQQVEFAPVDQSPVVLTDLDPLPDDSTRAADPLAGAAGAPRPSAEALNRLYRPQALDVPVLVARDAPIASLNPDSIGSFAIPNRDTPPQIAGAGRDLAPVQGPSLPQVVEALGDGVTVIAVRPAWIRVTAVDGSHVFEANMDAGDTFDVPQTEQPHVIRVGESGAIYFAVAGQTYGPAGPRGSLTSDLALSPDNLTENYQVADIAQDQDLARVVAELNLPQ